MIIKEVLIENYLCYYGIKKFNLSNGLNIILGENGEGKTKFFEALQWLTVTQRLDDDSNLDLLVSKKAFHELESGSTFNVRVEITVDQFGQQKMLSKKFTVSKDENNNCQISNFSITGIEESPNGERFKVDGYTLLENILPSQILKYIMFKGEDELNIFVNEDSLTGLVNLFSDARHYEKYESRGEYLKVTANKAVDQATKNNTKNQEEYSRIEKDISEEIRKKTRTLALLEETNNTIDKTKNNIKDAERYVNNAKALDIVNRRIRKLTEEISTAESRISENYTTSLLDEKWILVHFESIHREFSEKINNFSKEKRKLQSEFILEQGIKEGERRANINLMKNLVPLPIGTPSKAIMEEMIRDKFCKVCNRPAEKGSDALKFMTDRLHEYLESQEKVTNSEPESLFKFNYINKLVNTSNSHEDNLLNIRNIPKEIEDLFEFNQSRKDEIGDLKEKLAQEISERSKIIGSSVIGSEELDVVLKNYNTWQEDLISENQNTTDYLADLEKINNKLELLEKRKDEIDLTNANRFLINTRNILRNIDTILKETKRNKFDQFINLLQEKSNSIFSKINIDSFTGIINFKLNRTSKGTKVKVELQEEDGNIFYSPNQSLLTSMHISILLAISELTYETRNESYPLVFDAPTSSFGENKMTEFLNLIYERENQTIILIKDYIGKDENRNLYIKEEFDNVKRKKAFWLKLERPFDERNLKTINTEKIEL